MKKESGSLTPREVEILHLVDEGLSNKEIAERLRIAPDTVKNHMDKIFKKLGAHSRIQAIRRARTLGLWPEE